jgi:hypothetical protein
VEGKGIREGRETCLYPLTVATPLTINHAFAQLCILRHSDNFLRTKSITRNLFYFSENVLKLTYSNEEFKIIPEGDTPRPPLEGEGRGKKGDKAGSIPHQQILDPPLVVTLLPLNVRTAVSLKKAM